MKSLSAGCISAVSSIRAFEPRLSVSVTGLGVTGLGVSAFAFALAVALVASGPAYAQSAPLQIAPGSGLESFQSQVTAYETGAGHEVSSAAELSAVFAALDRDGNGTLDAEELRALSPSGVDAP